MSVSNIPPIFFINLKQDQTRRRMMEAQLDKIASPYYRIDGVDGRDLSEQSLKEIYSPEKANQYLGRDLFLGEVGCYLSHLKAMKAIVDSNAEYGLILEDDVEISDDLLPILGAIKALPFTWQTVQIGHGDVYCIVIWRERMLLPRGYEIGLSSHSMYGTQGYLITRELCNLFLEKAYPIFCTIDLHLFNICASFSFSHGLIGKQLVKHRSEIPSSIEQRKQETSASSTCVQPIQNKPKSFRASIKERKKRLFKKLFQPSLHGIYLFLFKYGFISKNKLKLKLVPNSFTPIATLKPRNVIGLYFYLMWYSPLVALIKKVFRRQRKHL